MGTQSIPAGILSLFGDERMVRAEELMRFSVGFRGKGQHVVDRRWFTGNLYLTETRLMLVVDHVKFLNLRFTDSRFSAVSFRCENAACLALDVEGVDERGMRSLLVFRLFTSDAEKYYAALCGHVGH